MVPDGREPGRAATGSHVGHAGDPRLAPLWDALARRMGASPRPVRRVRLTGLALATREALAGLLRLPRLPPTDITVQTDRVARAYGLDDAGLRRLVEELRGPLGDRAGCRDQAEAARRDAAAGLAQRADSVDRALTGWARGQAVAVDGDLSGQVAAVEAVLDVLADLDPGAPAPLPVVAAQRLGDPHALDHDCRLGRLLTSALAARAGMDEFAGATARRGLLRDAGLVDDELSSTVLAYRLPAEASHPAAAFGDEVISLTLGQLRRRPVSVGRRGRVLVVENPSVIAAAALRDVPWPVVCTAGVPSVAALTLLAQLRDGGCRLDVHADFDPAGLRIVDSLERRGARPHRMTAAAYLAAVSASGGLPRAHARVAVAADQVPDTAWDPALAAAMRAHGLAVYEEQVLDSLLAP